MFQSRASLLPFVFSSCLAGLLIAPTWVSRAEALDTEVATSEVVVTSVPDHGEVFLGMESIGSCPLTKRLPIGTFPLMVRQGTKIWQGTVDVKQGKTAKVVARLVETSKRPVSKEDMKKRFAWAPSWTGYQSGRSMEPNPMRLHKPAASGLGIAEELGPARSHAAALARALGQMSLSLKSHLKTTTQANHESSSHDSDLTLKNVWPMATWRRDPDHVVHVFLGLTSASGSTLRVPFLAYGAGSLLVPSLRESSDSAQLAALVSALCQLAMPKGISVTATLTEDRKTGAHPEDVLDLAVRAGLKARLESQKTVLDIESDWKTSEESSSKGARIQAASSSSWDATVEISQGKTITRIHVKDGIGFPEPGTSYQDALGALIDAMDALGAKVQWLETEIVNGAPAVTALISPPSVAETK